LIGRMGGAFVLFLSFAVPALAISVRVPSPAGCGHVGQRSCQIGDYVGNFVLCLIVYVVFYAIFELFKYLIGDLIRRIKGPKS